MSENIPNSSVTIGPSADDGPVFRAAITGAASGNNTLVAALTGTRIRVLALHVQAAGDVTVRFEDGASGTALTGVMSVNAESGITLPYCGCGWFQTTAATLLNMELGGAVQVSGCLLYQKIKANA